MTPPAAEDEHSGLVPSWGRRTGTAEPEPAPAPSYDPGDVARGQTEAVLGLLGRLQLRLDVLAREQAAALARVEERLTEIERRIHPRL